MLVKLGTVLKVQHGYAFKSENYVKKSPYRLVTLGNFSENNTFKYNNPKAIYYGANFPKEFILQENDLILPLTEQVEGLFGNTALVPCSTNYKFVLNQRVGKIICNESKVDKLYLHYLLASESVKKQLEARASGTRQRNISPENIYDVTVDLPNIELQIKIGLILKKIENQIESNNTIVKRLQVLNQGIFFKWFVQFEYPESNEKKIFNKFLNSEIPLGWKTYRLTDCIKWESSSQPPKSTFSDIKKEGYIRFIQNRDYDSADHITYIPLKETTKTCNKFDIMIDKYGDAGKIRYGLNGAFNVALAKLTPLFPYTQEYIRHFLMLDANYTYLHNACIASTRASLNEQTLSGIKICMPPTPLLRKFGDISKKMLNYQFKIIDETSKLEELKRKILPLLINEQLQ